MKVQRMAGAKKAKDIMTNDRVNAEKDSAFLELYVKISSSLRWYIKDTAQPK